LERLKGTAADDVYLKDIEGQVYLTKGDLEKAKQLFDEVTNALPNNPVSRLQLGETLLALGQAEEAIPHLNRVVRDFSYWPRVHQKLGIAYGKVGKLTQSHISLAEAAIVRKNAQDATLHLEIAEKNLPDEQPELVRKIKDLREYIERMEKL